MQHAFRRLAMPAFAAVTLLLITTVFIIAVHVLYSPASVHKLLWRLFIAAEVLFAVHYTWLHCKWCCSKREFDSPSHTSPKELGRQLIRHLQHVEDLKHYLKAWFLKSDHLAWTDFKRENFKELFAYALWYRTMGQMESEGLMPDLEDLILQLENALNSKLPAGYNPKLKFMSHLWDPIRHIYRPLFFYFVMEYLALVQHVALTAAGFQQQYWKHVSYYTYKLGPLQSAQCPAASTCATHSAAIDTAACSCNACQKPTATNKASLRCRVNNRVDHLDQQWQQGDCRKTVGQLPKVEDAPIVFLHGVGAGLLPYLALIFNLATLGRPMLLPESKHVSMRLVKQILSVDDMADASAALLEAYGASKAVMVGHSYGTFVASRMVLKYRDMVDSLCLLDPVCFAMFMPDLVKNFLYVRHHSGCLPIDIIMALVSSEIHCRTALSRNFWWTAMNLWDDAIPKRTLVGLSGRDILAPTPYVHAWLRDHTHAQVLHKPDLAHAGILVDLDYQQTVIEALRNVMNQTDAPSDASAAAYAAEAAEEVATDASNKGQQWRCDRTAADSGMEDSMGGYVVRGCDAGRADSCLSPDGVLLIDDLWSDQQHLQAAKYSYSKEKKQ